MKFVIPGDPIGKPRMTRSDKWNKRGCVVAYRGWADSARAALNRTTKLILEKPMQLSVEAHFAIPKSHKQTIPDNYHTVKPDGDNILKSVCDALFQNDQMVVVQTVTKYWAEQDGERVVIHLKDAI